MPSSPRFLWWRRYPVATFLVVLVLGFAVAPFEEHLPNGDQIEVARLSVILLAALLSVGDQRRTRFWGFALVMVALAGKWLYHWRPDQVSPAVFVVPGLLFVGVVIGHLLHFILSAPRVNSEVLCAGVSGYLLLGLLWAFAYVLVARLNPHAFAFTAGPASGQLLRGFTALYFSCITQATVGYGDIIPVSGVARMLSMLQAMTGTFYVAILISRLVAVYSTAEPAAAPGADRRETGTGDPA